MRLILLVALCCVFYLATAAPQSSGGKQSSSGDKHSSSNGGKGSSGGGKNSSSGGKDSSSGGKDSSSGGKDSSSEGKNAPSEKKSASGGGNSTSCEGNKESDDKSSTDMESAPKDNSMFPVITKWLLKELRQFMPTVYAIIRFCWNWMVSAVKKLVDVLFPGPILTYLINTFNKTKHK
ncbi:golgin subfamily A member 6-like protein 2 isoform X2 [Aricia agestis]|uniref:golgin subfamily A member 6-like protein 2 isoform X2 n=1 Tax=Aricia agestis TaxID=91739 RepID=UPI001C2094C3|nr:golgin subfamily A member 6-like protein 2 isoform X2 [Aricia agestis]